MVKVSAYRVVGYRRVPAGSASGKASAKGAYRVSLKLKTGTYVFRASHSDASHAATLSGFSQKVVVR